MSENRSPPPPAESCLERPRPSSQKGGTLIAEDIVTLEAHRLRLCDPGGYRPAECPGCGHTVVHAHEHRERVLRADVEPVITIAIYLCAGCGGTWRILPRFLARHLWRRWPVVQASTKTTEPLSSGPLVPERTLRRWHARLCSVARSLVVLLAMAGTELLDAVVHAVGLDATRAELAAAYSIAMRAPPSVFADLAALAHRLGPGLRLI